MKKKDQLKYHLNTIKAALKLFIEELGPPSTELEKSLRSTAGVMLQDCAHMEGDLTKLETHH